MFELRFTCEKCDRSISFDRELLPADNLDDCVHDLLHGIGWSCWTDAVTFGDPNWFCPEHDPLRRMSLDNTSRTMYLGNISHRQERENTLQDKSLWGRIKKMWGSVVEWQTRMT